MRPHSYRCGYGAREACASFLGQSRLSDLKRSCGDIDSSRKIPQSLGSLASSIRDPGPAGRDPGAADGIARPARSLQKEEDTVPAASSHILDSLTGSLIRKSEPLFPRLGKRSTMNRATSGPKPPRLREGDTIGHVNHSWGGPACSLTGPRTALPSRSPRDIAPAWGDTPRRSTASSPTRTL